MRETNKGRISIFDLNNISTKRLEEDGNSKRILNKYNIKTYKQLESLINIGEIKDYYLISSLYFMKEKFQIELEDVLTTALRVNKTANSILTTYNINTFQELKDAIDDDIKQVVNNAFLQNALRLVEETIIKLRETRVSQR